AAELAAAHHVAGHTEALQHDRAARRELAARQAEAEELFLAEWDRLFSPGPGGAQWSRAGERVPMEGQRFFSAHLSQMADETYAAAPVLRNELVNRRDLSSAAAAGRRNLIEAMLTRASERRLG